MNRRLSFYGFPGAGISSDWAPQRFANRFQLKKKVYRISYYYFNEFIEFSEEIVNRYSGVNYLFNRTCIRNERLVLEWEVNVYFNHVSTER